MAANMKSEKPPTPETPVEAATEPVAQPRLGRIEAPSGLKLKTVVLNVGKTFGRLVNWYASLTEIDREDMADRYRRQAVTEFEMQRYPEAADLFSELLKLNSKDAWACQSANAVRCWVQHCVRLLWGQQRQAWAGISYLPFPLCVGPGQSAPG